MKRVNLILNNERYKKFIKEIEAYEKDRQYCRHHMDHFLDVARIAYILVLERHMDIDKEMVYAAALLHDIGRAEEYRNGLSHHVAGLTLAGEILKESGFNENEKTVILDAIKYHRNETEMLDNFSSIFSKSDKLSRKCYNCEAIDTCNWNSDKKNYNISY